MVRRGEIWLVDAGDNPGSEVSFIRPVLVMQANAINRSAWKTVAVVGITSNTKYSDIPGNVFIGKDEGLLDRDSVVVCANLASLDKLRFLKKLAVMPDFMLDQVEFGLSIALDLK